MAYHFLNGKPNSEPHANQFHPFPLVALAMIGLLTLLWGVNFPRQSRHFRISRSFRVLCVTCGAVGMLSIGRLILGHSMLVHQEERLWIALAGCLNIWLPDVVRFALMSVDAGRGAVVAHDASLGDGARSHLPR